MKQEKKARGKERAKFVSTAEDSRQVKVKIVSRCHELGRNLHRQMTEKLTVNRQMSKQILAVNFPRHPLLKTKNYIYEQSL